MTATFTDYDLDRERLLRRRKLVEAMLADSQKGMGETQFAPGGFAIRRSPLEGIAKVAQAYRASNQQEELDTQEKELAQKRLTETQGALDEYQRKITPRAAVAAEMYGTEFSPEQQETSGQPAFAPNQQDKQSAAYGLLAKLGGDPRETAKLVVAQALKGPSSNLAKIDPKDYTPESFAAFLKGGDHSVLRPVRKVDFVNGQAVDPFTTKPGTRIDQPPTEIERELLAAGMVRGSPEWLAAMSQRVKKQTTHAPAASASVTMVQEKEEAKTVGKGFGEQYVDIQKGALAANTKLANLDRMQGLLEGVNTGKFTPLGTEVAAGLASMGFKIDPKLGNKQAIEALSNQMALELRNPSGGAGMPGAMSDQDREFLKKMVAGLGKDPQANKLIIDGARAMAKRDQEVAAKAREYRQRKGQLDEGFYNELKVWSDANPMFSATTGTSTGLTRNKDGSYNYRPGGGGG